MMESTTPLLDSSQANAPDDANAKESEQLAEPPIPGQTSESKESDGKKNESAGTAAEALPQSAPEQGKTDTSRAPAPDEPETAAQPPCTVPASKDEDLPDVPPKAAPSDSQDQTTPAGVTPSSTAVPAKSAPSPRNVVSNEKQRDQIPGASPSVDSPTARPHKASKPQSSASKSMQNALPSRTTPGSGQRGDYQSVPTADTPSSMGKSQVVSPTAKGTGKGKTAAPTGSLSRGQAGERKAGQPPTGSVHHEMPPPVSQWAAGETRKAFRNKFNSKELEAAKLIEKYDVDHNKTLDKEELRQLLRDYNNDMLVKDKEVQFIMTVADVDQDNKISQHEVLFALSAWHALINMPQSVGAAFVKYKVDGGPLLSLEDLRAFLVALNDHQPVSGEEATFVRNVALSLGATEEKADYEVMRKAVAVWYVNVERGPTSTKQLHNSAVADVRAHFSEDLKMFQGEFNTHSTFQRIVFVIAFIVFFVVPGTNIWLSGKVHSDYQCEHPHLSTMLWWSGVMMIAFGVSVLFAIITARCQERKALKTTGRAVCGTLGTAVLMQEIFGITHVMSSSMLRCGFVLWTACQFTFFVMPVVFVMSVCCGFPVLYYYEYAHNQKMDDSIKDDEPA